MLFLSLCFCWGLSPPIASFLLSAPLSTRHRLFLILTSPPLLSPSALPIPLCHFPSKGALCCSCLSISAVGTQFWAPDPVCAEGKLCLSKRVPTPAPGATKEAFFTHQWLPLTPGPLPLEGMSGFPRWHTETAIRGRKPGLGASCESCQGRGGGAQRAWGGVLCSKLRAVYIQTQAHKGDSCILLQQLKHTVCECMSANLWTELILHKCFMFVQHKISASIFV